MGDTVRGAPMHKQRRAILEPGASRNPTQLNIDSSRRGQRSWISQPIAAAATNANAGLRWLNATQPDIDEVVQALGRIVENGNRASEVIGGIRSLIKKSPPVA